LKGRGARRPRSNAGFGSPLRPSAGGPPARRSSDWRASRRSAP
jgi:hypothetical protein